MKTLHKIYFTIILFYFFNISLFAQFNTDSYKQFLTQNENLTTADLLQMHNAGLFENSADANWQNALFSDSIAIKYELTEDEINLINKNGFAVSERLQQPSFGAQFTDIYHKDLPVYISSDAILHAFHTTYDKILKDTELNILIGKLDELITSLQNNFPDLKSNVSTQADLDIMLKDLDIYLTVAKKLLTGSTIPYYEENVSAVDDLIKDIESEEFVTRPLFSESLRKIDFSQFKPRGHYDDEVYPQLANYFKTMMWFGKIELYLIAPKSFDEVPIEDVQRQIIMSALFSELIALSNQRELFDEIEFIIRTFVGEQDNVTLPDLNEVLTEASITSVDLLLDTLVVKEFQNVLKTKSYAGQKILSQILMSDPMSPDKIEPASAFMPFGQRFVIDSYVTGNVVYDKTEKKRMLPSTLDILFALGNDASAQLLKDELDTYEYSSNLAALRYLIDNYDSDFWKNSIYNLWLNSIKSLNPPEDRTALPNFMQTAAWWQQKMNSQLASWTELRHDNLLYAKQSYSGGVTCSYPFSYVEPIPLFFKTIGLTATETINKINMISSFDSETKEKITSHFKYWELITDTLETIAQKELDRTALDENEKGFLSRMLYNNPQGMCGVPEHIGWYPSLYYYNKEEMNESNFLVADYHTAPTDASGNFVGWVKHAGTGPIDLAIIIAKNSDNQDVAFVGPVSSYYEFTSDNFLRLTDDEWKESYLLQSARPNWTNIYLADNSGKVKSEGLKLLTDVKKDDVNSIIPQSFITAQNYPNPF
ncbi:MAG: DUF3160 domain-containing protein, partial [Ignavibacteriae bacterium]|nr:DUF3160 domain-containing protein [Ignavibacteriota bacterium]